MTNYIQFYTIARCHRRSIYQGIYWHWKVKNHATFLIFFILIVPLKFCLHLHSQNYIKLIPLYASECVTTVKTHIHVIKMPSTRNNIYKGFSIFQHSVPIVLSPFTFVSFHPLLMVKMLWAYYIDVYVHIPILIILKSCNGKIHKN